MTVSFKVFLSFLSTNYLRLCTGLQQEVVWSFEKTRVFSCTENEGVEARKNLFNLFFCRNLDRDFKTSL